MFYKAPDNSLHSIDPEFAEFLPAGSIQISDEEAQEIQAANIPEPTALDKLNALDSKHVLTQRNLRETIMLMNEAFKRLSNGDLDLSAIPGVAAVYAVEAEAEELRAQL